MSTLNTKINVSDSEYISVYNSAMEALNAIENKDKDIWDILGKYQLEKITKIIFDAFLNQNVVESKGNKLSSSVLYEKFTSWIQDNRFIEYYTTNRFAEELNWRGYKNSRIASGKVWSDIQISINTDVNTYSGNSYYGKLLTGVMNKYLKTSLVPETGETCWVSTIIETTEPTNIVPPNGMFFLPKYLIIPEDIDKHAISLKILSCGNILYDVSFDFLRDICESKKVKNMIHYKLIGAPYIFPVTFEIRYDQSIIKFTNPITLISLGVYGQITPTAKQYIVGALQSQMYNYDSPKSTIKIQYRFKYISKGYYIVGDIDNLTSIILTINNVPITLGKDLLHIACERINNNVLYLPFNTGEKALNYEMFDTYLFKDGLNMSCINSMTLELGFDVPQTSVVIHCIAFNIILYSPATGAITKYST